MFCEDIGDGVGGILMNETFKKRGIKDFYGLYNGQARN